MWPQISTLSIRQWQRTLWIHKKKLGISHVRVEPTATAPGRPIHLKRKAKNNAHTAIDISCMYILCRLLYRTSYKRRKSYIILQHFDVEVFSLWSKLKFYISNHKKFASFAIWIDVSINLFLKLSAHLPTHVYLFALCVQTQIKYYLNFLNILNTIFVMTEIWLDHK